MTTTEIDLNVWAQQFEASADWRREKAKEFPDDAARNLNAAKELNSLAAQFEAGDVDLELVAEYVSLGNNDVTAHRLSEVEGELLRQVGFHSSFNNADDYIRAIIRDVRA